MRIGLNGSNLLFSPDVGAIVDDVTTAESEGFSSYWLGQVSLVDSLVALGASGASTSSIEVGTAVVPTWTQHPLVMATKAWTVQSMVAGRLILGIGLAHQPTVEERLKLTWEKPVRHMIEYLTILNDVFASGTAAFEGEVWSLEAELPPFPVDPPKVMVAALGDQMLRVAGKRTDGTILWCVGPKAIETHIAPRINEAAADADRPAPAIVCSVPCWVTDEPDKARGFLASILGNYAELPSYRAMLDIEGIHGLDDLSFVGSEQEVRDRIGEVAESGATDFTGVVMGGNPDEIAATRSLLASL